MRLLVLVAVAVIVVSALPADYVRVPGGKLFHKECVHRVPNGGHVEVDSQKNTKITADGETTVHPPCPHPVIKEPLHGPAWKAWTEFNNTKPITKLTTQWGIPPPPPSYSGQILYYWNGIEPADNSAVLQPVLQYGDTPAGGGQYWAVASWYVSAVTATFSEPATCVGAASVIGDLAIDSSGQWTITSICGSKKTTLTYTPPDKDYTWAYPCVLEAYSVENCATQYPTSNSLAFNNIMLWVENQQVSPTWKPQTKNNSCNEHATVTSTSQVAILWNTK